MLVTLTLLFVRNPELVEEDQQKRSKFLLNGRIEPHLSQKQNRPAWGAGRLSPKGPRGCCFGKGAATDFWAAAAPYSPAGLTEKREDTLIDRSGLGQRGNTGLLHYL